MILLDMKIQEVLRRKILATLRTAIDMSVSVVNLIVFVRPEREGFPMRWKRTLYDLGDGGSVSVDNLGAF